MILDKSYFLKISTEDDIEKINYAGRQLGSAGAFRPVTLKCVKDSFSRKGLLFAKRSFIFAKRTFIMAKTIYKDYFWSLML